MVWNELSLINYRKYFLIMAVMTMRYRACRVVSLFQAAFLSHYLGIFNCLFQACNFALISVHTHMHTTIFVRTCTTLIMFVTFQS